MQLVLRPALLLTLLAGCEPSAGDKSDDTSGAADDTSSDSGGDVDYASELPDLTSDLDESGCEEVSGTAHEGAATYFYGVFSNEDGFWSGKELWILYANDKLVEAESWQEATSGTECQLYWATEATEVDPGDTSCATCDVALEVTLTLDVTLTDCPEDLYEPEASGTESYAVKYTSDTEATWYFAGSGNEFGQGYHNEGAMNFLTSKACKWF